MKLLKLLCKPLEIFKSNQHIYILKTLWPFLWLKEKNIRARFFGAFLIIFFSTLLTIGVPLLLKKAIELLDARESSQVVLVFSIVALYGVFWTLGRALVSLRQVLMFRVMEKAVMHLSARIFDHLLSQSYDFHVKRKTGEIVSAIEKAQLAFPGIIWPLFFLIIPTFLEVIVVSLLLTYLYGFSYGMLMLATVAVFLVFSVKALNWWLVSQRESNEKHYKCQSNIVDSFVNFSTIKLFNNQRYEFDKCLNLLDERQESQVKTLLHARYISLGQDLIIGMALIIFSLMCAHKVLYGGYGISDFVLINAYVLQFAIPLGSLGFIIGDFQKQLTQMEKTIELFGHKTGIKDGDKPIMGEDQGIAVICKDIHFGYEPTRPILQGISFSLLPGKTVAFVGPTGSGKSTLMNLLLRFYDYQSGEMYINGEDIRTIKQESLFRSIAVVPQDIALFNDTLRSNLLYGNPLASEEMLMKGIELALLSALVSSLPDGLETVVGERGLALSSGERQRVGIARAWLKNPSFYIFDEATSALDIQTEEKIMQNIREETKNATVLIIAHRLSTIRSANEIFVFNKGKVAESGSHEELIKKKGIYANMCMLQSKD